MAERNLLAALDLRELVCGIGNQLRYVDRFSTCRRNHRENVAEHQFYTAFFTLLIASHIDMSAEGLGFAVVRALIHDVEEHYTGDTVRPVKHGDAALKAGFEKVGAEFTMRFFRSLTTDEALSGWLTRMWSNAKDASVAGRIVKFADSLSVLAYLNQEVRSGNHLIMDNVNQLKYYFTTTFEKTEFDFIRPLVVQALQMVEALDHKLRGGFGEAKL